jgi:hypothetical protein
MKTATLISALNTPRLTQKIFAFALRLSIAAQTLPRFIFFPTFGFVTLGHGIKRPGLLKATLSL